VGPLITVSGTITDEVRAEIAAGRRPRADYDELASAASGEVVDYDSARHRGRTARTIARLLGADAALAWACLRRRREVSTVFTDSERVGMLYAALTSLVRRRPRHVMIGHRLSSPKKLKMHKALRLARRIDHVLVYSSAQRTVAINELGYAPERVTLTPFMVDTAFWKRDAVAVSPRRRPMICAAGQELRDYPTLIAAAGELDVDVVIAAASPWSKRADTSAGIEIPANVTVSRLHPFDLRHAYAEATIVVVPLQNTDFQAGITTILEGMSMGVPVVCTQTPGQTDTIVDGETGVYVPPGDPRALTAAIASLLDDPARRERIATSARRWAQQHADIERYTAALAGIIAGTPR
jgi:glycosyltransferase involved in cell wall biosynthesis